MTVLRRYQARRAAAATVIQSVARSRQATKSVNMLRRHNAAQRHDTVQSVTLQHSRTTPPEVVQQQQSMSKMPGQNSSHYPTHQQREMERKQAQEMLLKREEQERPLAVSAASATLSARAPDWPAVREKANEGPAAVAAFILEDACRPAPAGAMAVVPPPAPPAQQPTADPQPSTPLASAEQPATPAPATGGEIEWTCDLCRVAKFESFDAAVEHERTCEGNPPPPTVTPI